MRIPSRPIFRGADRDADQFHAEANNQRLEHIMTLLEALLISSEATRQEANDRELTRKRASLT